MSLFPQRLELQGNGERLSITEAIARLPVTNFSVLELYILWGEAHVIGPPVSWLLQIFPAIQRLKLVVCQSEVTYPLDLNMCAAP